MKEMNLGGQVKESPIIGIDLGTTNSAVAIYNAGTVPTLLPIGHNGGYTVPSCVRWNGKNELGENVFTVGYEAYQERYLQNIAYSIKRIMGSGRSVILTLRTRPPYPSPTDLDWDDDLDAEFTPAEISAEILRYLKQRTAELYYPVTDCVITVPAYFNQRQIEDTLEASRLAGLNCRQILKEPTSASYIYSQLGHAASGNVLIYDLGGGTFDVTHMNFLRKDAIPKKMLTSLRNQYGIELDTQHADNTDQYFCRVLGTYGDVNLGGDDIDKAMAEHLIATNKLTLTVEEKEKLYLYCEDFKKSKVQGTQITVGGKKVQVTNNDLDFAVDQIFDKTLRIMEDIDMTAVKTIVLVGGSTKSQRLRDDLSAAFPGIEISAVLDPDATVALGAGSVAKAIANDSSLMYADVLPLPIGVLVDEKRVDVCIAKNTSMPYTVSKVYHTLHDNQSQITVHVYQGLSSNPEECTYLGRLTLTDIPKAPAGEVNVVVDFVLTGQGRLKIVSRIDGINREEELVIDNIFDVKSIDSVRNDSADNKQLMPSDDFEEVFMPLAANKEDVLDMFRQRRVIRGLDLSEEDKSKQLQSIEDDIVSAVM